MNQKQTYDYNTTQNKTLRSIEEELNNVKTALNIKDVRNGHITKEIKELSQEIEKQEEKIEKRLTTIEHRLYYIIIALLLILITNFLKTI